MSRPFKFKYNIFLRWKMLTFVNPVILIIIWHVYHQPRPHGHSSRFLQGRHMAVGTRLVYHVMGPMIYLLDRNIIDKKLYWKLNPTDSTAPRFHGLSKIHKAEIPIVSYTGTPLYKLSKYIASILTTFKKSGMDILRTQKSFLNLFAMKL